MKSPTIVYPEDELIRSNLYRRLYEAVKDQDEKEIIEYLHKAYKKNCQRINNLKER